MWKVVLKYSERIGQICPFKVKVRKGVSSLWGQIDAPKEKTWARSGPSPAKTIEEKKRREKERREKPQTLAHSRQLAPHATTCSANNPTIHTKQ